MKLRDKVYVTAIDGKEFKGIIVNVNEWREPSMMYAIALEGNLGTVFVGKERLRLQEENDK